jgi:tetratricopeptide (TPR) repeat protein
MLRFGSFGTAVVNAQAKTESSSTVGLLATIGALLKDKAPAEGTDTAPSAIEPEAKRLVVATRELLQMRDKALAPLKEAVADAQNADLKDVLAKAEARIYIGLCVTEMRRYITPDNRLNGTFDGMFAALDKYDREKIGDAFLEIFQTTSQTATMRDLAGEGLGQMGSARHQPALKAIIANQAETERIRRRALYTLARLGDRGPVDRMLAGIASKMEEAKKPDMTPQETRSWAEGYYLMALHAQNIHDSELAIKHYESFIGTVEAIKDKLTQKDDLSGTYYNLACLYSLKGDVETGLKHLDKSFESGYENYKWANTDGDLANLRKDPRFKTMIEKWESGKKPESAPAR